MLGSGILIRYSSQFVYAKKLSEFLSEVDDIGCFTNDLIKRYKIVVGKHPAKSEIDSWKNSLAYMQIILMNSFPGDCGILIEFKLANSGCRIDFVIAGVDENENRNFIIIELKQWSEGNVKTTPVKGTFYIEGGNYESNHPSEQANDYKIQMELWCEPVYNGRIHVRVCSFLHNFSNIKNNPLQNCEYVELLDETPMFLMDDREKLRQFIRKYVGGGNGCDILYEIRNGEIKPSPKLIDAVRSMFERTNNERGTYILLDAQKIAYREILHKVLNAREKEALIINGGPGTGKSVVAMNALVELLKLNKKVVYTTPNESFRLQIVNSLIDVTINEKNAKTIIRKISNVCSDKFIEVSDLNGEKINKKIIEDAIIVDEAHLLKKPKVFGNWGEHNQVWEIMDKSIVSIFFVDDRQVLNLDEIGTVDFIKQEAKNLGITVKTIKLDTQFRCSGSDEYVEWLDNLLQYNLDSNITKWNGDFKFVVYSNPNEMKNDILNLRNEGYDARLLAGYAWKWDKNGKGQSEEIQMPEYNFKESWNSANDNQRYKWAFDSNMSNQIGCVHTCIGEQFDYVGVIIGNDLVFDEETNSIKASFMDYCDPRGRRNFKDKPELLTKYVKNIYRILMTRPTMGCYVFCRDKKLNEWFKNINDKRMNM